MGTEVFPENHTQIQENKNQGHKTKASVQTFKRKLRQRKEPENLCAYEARRQKNKPERTILTTLPPGVDGMTYLRYRCAGSAPKMRHITEGTESWVYLPNNLVLHDLEGTFRAKFLSKESVWGYGAISDSFPGFPYCFWVMAVTPLTC